MKKIPALLILFVVILFAVNTGRTLAATTETASGFSGNVATEINKAELFVTTKTPLGRWFDLLEAYRVRTSANIDKKIEEIKAKISLVDKKIDEANSSQKQLDADTYKETSYVTKDSGSFLEQPLDHAKLFFYDILSFIYSHKWLFYLLFGFVVYLILRKIFRLIFSK